MIFVAIFLFCWCYSCSRQQRFCKILVTWDHNIEGFNFCHHLSHLMTKPMKWHVRPAMTQISLGIRPVWSVVTVHMKKAWILSFPLSTQPRLWSDWVDAQAELSLRWLHSHFVGFVIRRLIYFHKVYFLLKKILKNKSLPKIDRYTVVVLLRNWCSRDFVCYLNDLKFLDRQVWATSVPSYQTAPEGRSSLIRVYTICHSFCIFCCMSQIMGKCVLEVWQIGKAQSGLLSTEAS